MKEVCFTGHRKLSREEITKIFPILSNKILDCLNKGIRMFYTAEAGDFDNLVLMILNEFKCQFCDICVVAIHGKNKGLKTKADKIIRPNNFILEFEKIILDSLELICYVNDFGCAFRLRAFADKNFIAVTNIYDMGIFSV